jgi:Glutaredoxin
MIMTMIPSQPSVHTGMFRRSLHVVITLMIMMYITTRTTTTVSSFTTIILPSTTGRPCRGSTSTPPTVLYNTNTSGGGGGILSDFFNAGKAKLMKSMAGDYDGTVIQEQINTYIQNNPVLMFSFDTCPYCIKAKSILDSKNIKYVVLTLR